MSRRPPLRLLLGFALSTVLLVLLLHAVQIEKVMATLRSVRPDLLALLVLLHAVILGMRIQRWGLIVDGGSRPSWRRRRLVAEASLVGWFVDSALPLKAGEVARPWVYARSTGRSFLDLLGTVTLERVLDLMALAALFALAFGVLPGARLPDGFAQFAIFGFVASLGGFVAVLSLRRWGPTEMPEFGDSPSIRVRALAAAVRFREGLGLFDRPALLARVVAWTTVIWVVETGAVALTLAACGVDLAWATGPSGLAASGSQVVISTVALGLPSAPTGIGVDQWATIFALRPFGVDDAVATAVSIVDIACVLIWVLPLGLLAVFRGSAGPGVLRELEERPGAHDS
ncbi:MAG: lysylphosphatidylglycerol synthase transmembrane domain-containing protein [Myxococcota bacterium]|nr:lysylphosphatidylglycerol synthase transmembrane domain-containing protein [Myxococcota bacterium]